MDNTKIDINIVSLCSGVGGIEFGLKNVTGGRTICYVEREPFNQAVLLARMEENFLEPAPIWDDIRTFDGKQWRGTVDIVVAGYPCQGFSSAGKRKGKNDERYLWPEVKRIIGETNPAFVFIENVPNHLNIGFRETTIDLREMGFDVAAGLFSAEEVGAPHLRKRLFALAYREVTGQLRTSELENHMENRIRRWRYDVAKQSSSMGIFPPRPSDERWDTDETIGDFKPVILGKFNGISEKLDKSTRSYRQDRIRAMGNAVMPITAGIAFITLLRRINKNVLQSM